MRIKRTPTRYKEGDYKMQCDHSGRVDYRSNMVKLWNGLWVHKDYYEIRNPQDFIKIRQESQAVEEARPRTEKTYVEVSRDDL
jgi:hypothetical protein